MNVFKAATGAVMVWNSKVLDLNIDLLFQLKYEECYTRLDIQHNSDFELSAIDLDL